jgi:phosphate transport system permease protein
LPASCFILYGGLLKVAYSADGVRPREELWRRDSRRSRLWEQVVKAVFGAFALVSVLTTAGIVFVLIFETVAFFRAPEVSIVEYLTGTRWTPLFASQNFGVLALVSATLLTTFIAAVVALPVGLLAAIYLSEYASERARRLLKPALEVLAGVPTIVYGYFALTLVTPFLRNFLPLSGFNGLSAGLVMGVMIIPMVASLSEDAMYAVPRTLREGAYALGATKREVATKVVVPAALSGIVASFILGISRAIGETMIVTVAAGLNPRFGFDPFVPIQTMTAYIVQVSLGDTPATSLAYKTIFAVGMTLFVMTLVLNIVSNWFVRRYKEKYE